MHLASTLSVRAWYYNRPEHTNPSKPSNLPPAKPTSIQWDTCISNAFCTQKLTLPLWRGIQVVYSLCIWDCWQARTYCPWACGGKSSSWTSIVLLLKAHLYVVREGFPGFRLSGDGRTVIDFLARSAVNWKGNRQVVALLFVCCPCSSWWCKFPMWEKLLE